MVWIILAICAFYFIYRIVKKPSKCDVCGSPFRRKHYKVTIAGKYQWLCPNCNTQMEKKNSKEAFKVKIG